MQLFNPATQELEDVTGTVDDKNEIILTFADGGFVKFPAGLDQKAFDAAVAAHNAGNVGQEVITEESIAAAKAEKAASYALIGGTPEETTTDVPSEQTL